MPPRELIVVVLAALVWVSYRLLSNIGHAYGLNVGRHLVVSVLNSSSSDFKQNIERYGLYPLYLGAVLITGTFNSDNAIPLR